MRILIYGAGAVGCYIGGHMAAAGHTVTLLGRDRVTRPVQDNGLTIQPADPQARAIVLKDIRTATTLAEALHGHSAFDLVVFAMKAFDTAHSIQELRLHSDASMPVLCLQNGVGNEDIIKAEAGSDRVIAGAMTTAVSMETAGVVREERNRGVALASDSAAYPVAQAAFHNTAILLRTVGNSASLKWSKLLTNMIANAVSAILDMPPSQIMQDRRLFELEVQALREALAIIDLQGIQVTDLPGVPPATPLTFLIRRLPYAVLHPLLRAQFVSARGDKLPSLTVALRKGDMRTEVAWLNGAVAQAARSLDRLAPINHALALIVSDIASHRVPWEMYRHRPATLLAAVRTAKGNPTWRYGE